MVMVTRHGTLVAHTALNSAYWVRERMLPRVIQRTISTEPFDHYLMHAQALPDAQQ